MNQSEYPNRDALRQANDIYLDAMRAFIIHHLKQIRGEKVENLIEDVLYDNQVNQFRQMLDKHKDIGLAIDFTYIPHIIKEYWKDDFADKFEDNLVAQNMLWLIRNGRNECEHRGHDLDPEFTRTHLFIIAELLGKINRSDKQKEVLVIRDQFLTDNAAKQISEMTEQLETEKTDKKKYKRDFEKIQRQLEDLENQHETDKQDLEKLELQLKEADTQKKTIEENLTNIEDDLKTAEDNLKAAEDAWIESDKNLKSKMVEIQNIENEKKRIEGQYELLKKQFEGVQKENQKYKENLASIENQLSDAKTEKRNTEERLSTLVNPVFPPLDNDLNVYILDRRETDRKKYIISLLETKRPSIIYVDSEEKIEVFFEYIAGEKADAIGRHSEYSSDTAEKELLEKLENGDLIALVSNATFTTIPDQHVIEHFVFCHPILDFDEFCQQCQPAFMPIHNTYLHLIYDTTQEFETYSNELNQKYLKRDDLLNLYGEARNHVNTDGNSVKFESLCNKLKLEEAGVKTGLAIFEELSLIEKNSEKIKFLESNGKKELENSKIYCEGKRLKEKISRESYQLGMDSIENIWGEIMDTLGIEKNHTIHEQEVNTYRTNNGSQYETDIDETDSA